MTESSIFNSVSDYVSSMGGNKPIETILIANNGIAAVKCIRSMRKWAYQTFGNERAIQFVAMATPGKIKEILLFFVYSLRCLFIGLSMYLSIYLSIYVAI